MTPRVALLTREYPPDVYGGAGVHVEYLARELGRLEEVTVHCWGGPRPEGERPPVVAHGAWEALAGPEPHRAALAAMSIDLAMAAAAEGADVVHSHTWYANLGGHLAALVHGIPHVATVHSLEPLRPWKAEQLGGGYALSSWCERVSLEAADAVVAVSDGMRRDVLACYPAIRAERVHVIRNGIDADEYRPDEAMDALVRHGVDPDVPAVVFVGRITRQKGVLHLLRAALRFAPESQLVLCAGAPDTPELAAEVRRGVERLRGERGRVVWVEQMLPRSDVIQLLSHAAIFVCPSVYEPLGIVNLEAMACEAPVVATATGGIAEVVDDGTTGLLVPIDPRDDGTGEPRDPDAFAGAIAERVNALLADPGRRRAMGRAGRERAAADFSWAAIAERTAALHADVAGRGATAAAEARR